MYYNQYFVVCRRDWKIKKIEELDYKVKKSQVQNLPTRCHNNRNNHYNF